MKRAKALRLFKHTFQIVHIDGLTFDFLFGLAKDLAEKQELALLGAGFKGSLPLIVRDRGSLKTRLII